MKRILLVIICVMSFASLASKATVPAQGSEEAAIRMAIEHYFRGHATGDPDYFRKVFHPDSKLFWIRDGKLTQLTSGEYIARAVGNPPDDEAHRKRSILSIDITGNAAVVKVLLDYPNARLTDYMSMLKIDGEWKIVNKIFVSEPKARS